MKKTMLPFLMVLLSLAIVLSGCTTQQGSTGSGSEESDGSDGNQKEGTSEKVLLLNNVEEPTSLDPPIGFDSLSYNILNNTMEGMTRLGKDHQPQPAMASEWKKSDDGLTYTFTIREDAEWSNGDPVTAEDFEYAWKRLANPETAAAPAFLAYIIKGAEAYNKGEGSADEMMVQAVDEKTLKVTLAYPQSYFLSVISIPPFFPVHKETVENNPEWASEVDTLVTNGPFTMTDWQHDSKIIMKKNENYWDAETVKLDSVVWEMVNDTNTEYQMYKTDELHTSAVPSDLSEQLFEKGVVNVKDQSGVYFYRFNTTMKPFDNQKIRKAFSMAINREEIVKFITKNKEKVARGFVSYGFADPAGSDFREVGGDLVNYDPEKAKQLLKEGMKEAGYDQLPKITLSYNTSESHKEIAVAMQEMFSKVLGVEVELTNQEWSVFSSAQKELKLQFSRSSFLNDFADPINSLESFITGSSMNRTGWSNKKFDSLIQSAYNESDNAKRMKMLHEAEKILFEEAPITPIYFYNRVYLQKDYVKDIVRHPVGYLELKWADMTK